MRLYRNLLSAACRKSVTINFFSFIVFDNGFRRGDRNVRQKYLNFVNLEEQINNKI